MVRPIDLSWLLWAFGLCIRRGGLSWRYFLRELLWLLGELSRFFLLLGVGCDWRKISEGSGLLLCPVLNRGLSNCLFEGMLRIGRLGLYLNLLLVLLMYWLMIEITGGLARILICARLDRRRNFLVVNSRENILVLLLLRHTLWDIWGA